MMYNWGNITLYFYFSLKTNNEMLTDRNVCRLELLLTLTP